MAKLITEHFNLKNINYKAKDGHIAKFIAIEGNGPDRTFNVKDTLYKFGAKYKGYIGYCGWFINGADDPVWENNIIPCYKYLLNVEENGKGGREGEIYSLISQVQFEETIEEIAYEASTLNIPEAEKIKQRLREFQEKLCYLDSDEFKREMAPVLAFQAALGHRYSFHNTLLIWLQDPEAKMVKSKSGWVKMNREVIFNPAPIRIILWRPNRQALQGEEKKAAIENFLIKAGVSSENELSPGQKEQLRVLVNGGGKFKENDSAFKHYYAYDIRFTAQMKNREVVVDPNAKNEYEWYDKSTEESEKIELLVNAMTKVIENSGVKIERVSPDKLGGALGVSMSGKIQLLDPPVYTKQYLSTMVHEYSHEILHQDYIRKSSNSDLAQFYIGRKQGRGMIEQQAEMCAWAVLCYHGLESNAHLNYIAGWGAKNAKEAVAVLETIGACATRILQDMAKAVQGESADVPQDNQMGMDNETYEEGEV